MSIQPIFAGPFLLPSQQLQSSFKGGSGAQQPGSVSIDGGPNVGNVFDGKGNDFLDPSAVQKTTDNFSNTVKPNGTDTLITQLVPPDPFGKNPDPVTVLNGTINGINIINDPNIGRNLLPRANSNPIAWHNPTALDIQLGATFSGDSIVTGIPFFPGVPGSVTPGGSLPPTGTPPGMIPGYLPGSMPAMIPAGYPNPYGTMAPTLINNVWINNTNLFINYLNSPQIPIMPQTQQQPQFIASQYNTGMPYQTPGNNLYNTNLPYPFGNNLYNPYNMGTQAYPISYGGTYSTTLPNQTPGNNLYTPYNTLIPTSPTPSGGSYNTSLPYPTPTSKTYNTATQSYPVSGNGAYNTALPYQASNNILLQSYTNTWLLMSRLSSNANPYQSSQNAFYIPQQAFAYY